MIIPLAAGLCMVVAVVGLTAAVTLMLRTPAQDATGAALAASLNLTPLNPNAGHKTPTWYGGTHNGRRYALAPVNVRGNRYAPTSNLDALSSLAVIIEVQRSEPMPEPLPSAAKSTADAFRAKHKSLRFQNRASVKAGVLVPELLPDAIAIAMVTKQGEEHGPPEVIALVEELAAVAKTMEP